MTESSQPLSHPAPDGKVGGAVAALESLHWLLERASIYPPGHPAVVDATERTLPHFDEVLSGGALRAEIGRGVVRVNPEGPDAAPADSFRCRSLAVALNELDVTGLEFREGLTGDDLIEFCSAVARLRSEGGAAESRRLWEDGGKLDCLRVRILDYSALRFDDGTETGRVGDDPGRLWDALSQAILGPPDSPAAVTPEQLAEVLGEERAEVLGPQLQRLIDDVQHLPTGSRRDARVRVGRFLVALPEGLRNELLRIDSRVEALRPESIVTTLLFHAVRTSGQPPEDAVALMNQLLRTGSDDTGRKVDLHEIFGEDASGEISLQNLEELGEMVHEVFLKREDIRANPRDYQALIDSLAKGGVESARSAGAWKTKYRDPSRAASVHAHAVEIAALQFGRPGAERHARGVVAFLQGSTEALLEGGRFAPLGHAVAAVEEFTRTAVDDEDPERLESAVRAAHDYLEDALRPDRLRAIVDGLPRDEAPPASVRELLRRGGEEALPLMLGALESDTGEDFRATLHDLILELPDNRVLREIESRVAGGWSVLRPVFPLLERLDSSAARELAQDLVRHEDERVRSRAFAMVVSANLGSEEWSEVLYRVLRDSSPKLVRTALRKLGELPGSEPVDLLQFYVRGRFQVAGAAPPLELRLLAVRVLTLKGAEGWEALGEVLSRLGWRLGKDDVSVSRAIVDAIRHRFDGEDARRLLRGWGAAPARWLGGLLVRNKRKAKVTW